MPFLLCPAVQIIGFPVHDNILDDLNVLRFTAVISAVFRLSFTAHWIESFTSQFDKKGKRCKLCLSLETTVS